MIQCISGSTYTVACLLLCSVPVATYANVDRSGASAADAAAAAVVVAAADAAVAAVSQAYSIHMKSQCEKAF